MIVLFLVVLVVFGPQKLPELARGLGKLMAEFRKASTDFKSAFEEEMREMERAAMQAERRKAAEAAAVTSPPSSEGQPEQAAIQDPAISPVAESVQRSSEEWTEPKTETATVTDSQDTLHDHQHPA